MTPKIAAYDKATLYAVRALIDGVANEGQQKLAVEWILKGPCRMRHPSFSGESDRHTSFYEGCRFVGLQIAGMSDPKALDYTIEALTAAEALAARTTPRGKRGKPE